MGKKKTKAGKELTKNQRIEQKKLKQAAKGAKKERKQHDEEDIEVILQEILRKEAIRTEVVIESCVQPSPRANFSMTMLPNGEMLLFGGEYFDGDVNVCYNELYRWNIDGGPTDWKRISSLQTPPPRCSHQAVLYRDHLYLFGGEFATADQFHHYRDFWRLDLKTNAWEALEDKGGPSARSGHRMVVWRQYLVVFGGFYEAARETKWFNDLYLFHLGEMKWTKVTYPLHKAVPNPRSGCQLAVHPSNDTIFMYGGYAKVKSVGEKAQGKVFSDLWALNMTPVLKKQAPTWEKMSRKGQAPSPRSGAAVTVHKQRFILFGGVYDEEQRRHTMQSTFYNDLYVYDMDRRRWFEFKLRGKKKSETKRRRVKKVKENLMPTDQDGEDDEEEEDDFEQMLENQFGYIDEHGQFVYIQDEEEENEQEGVSLKENIIQEEEEEKKEEEADDMNDGLPSRVIPLSIPVEEKIKEEEIQTLAPAPCPRINPSIIIRGSTLYVYGGVVEDGDREITLDDCWSLDLKRLEEWKEVLPGTMNEQVWKGEVSETEESSDGEESDEDSDDEDDDDEEEDEMDRKTRKKQAAAAVVERAVSMLKSQAGDEDEDTEKKKNKKDKKKNDRRSIRAEIESLQEQLGLDDIDRTPQMGENLRDFFARTQETWAKTVISLPETQERQLSVKEIKREGFVLAEERYQELLPILERLNVLEAEQKEMEEEYLLKKKHGKEKSRRG